MSVDIGACVCSIFNMLVETPSLNDFLDYMYTLGVIQKSPKEILLDGEVAGISVLRSTGLSLLVRDEKLAKDALLLFRAIHKWANADAAAAAAADPEAELTPEDRNVIAKELITNVELRLICPMQLIGEVMEPGLVSADQIMPVLQKQADGAAVVVEGAGIPGVNGIYEQNYSDNEPNQFEAVYEKQGLLEEDEVTFAIVVSRGNVGQVWQLIHVAPPKNAGII